MIYVFWLGHTAYISDVGLALTRGLIGLFLFHINQIVVTMNL
jgi:hypothetical protein